MSTLLQMKRFLVFLSVLLILALLAGCGSQPKSEGGGTPKGTAPPAATGPKQGGNLVVATTVDPPSLDPHVEASDVRTRFTVLIYENLVWVDQDLRVQPQLATSWDISPDGKVYTFHLRQGVKFSNGQEMTAEDVKYSYNRLRDPKTGSAGRGDLALVQSIEVVDRNTVRFTLSAPQASFLAAIGGRYSAVVPKDVVKTGNELKQNALGTGPFMLKEWVPKQKMVLVKNPYYWDKDHVYLNSITFQVIPDENSIIAALRAGQVDWALLNDAKNYKLVKDDKNLVVERHSAIRWEVMDFACDQKPLDSPLVREAIELAIDKQAVMEAATQGVGTVIGEMPPAMKDFVVPTGQLPNQKRDVAKAKQLLSQAGYPSGTDMTLRIIQGYPEMPAVASVIAANLKDIGINARVETVDLGVWIKDWGAGKNPTTLNAWGGFMDPDLLYYRHFHKKPQGGDFRRWNNDKGSQLLDEGRNSVDPKQRQKIYAEFQKLLATDAPTVPLYSADDVTVAQKSVQGYIHHPSGWYYGLRGVWLNK